MQSSRASKVFALSFGKGLTTLVALVSGMVMARVLTQTELATYRQTLLAYQIAIPLLSLGMTQGIYYFLPTEKTRMRGVVVDALIMMVVMGSLYAVFIALGGNHLLAKRFSNPAIVDTLVYLIPLPLVMLPAGLLSSVLVVQNQVNRLAVYNVLSNLALGCAVVIACLYWKRPEYMVITKVGLSILVGLVALFLITKSLPKDEWKPKWKNMKKMVAFSIPLVIATTLGSISLELDKVIVSSMCSPEEFAIYYNGAIKLPLIGIMTGSIAAVIQPDLRRMVSAGNNRGAIELFRQAAEKSAVILIPVMIFLMISADSFIITLFSKKYAESVFPFRLYLLMLPARIVYFGPFLIALGLNKLILYRSIAGLTTNLILSILFVNLWGYNGAILATIVTLYTMGCAWFIIAISRVTECCWQEIIPLKKISSIFLCSLLSCVPLLVLKKLISINAVYMLLLSVGIYSLTLFILAIVFPFCGMRDDVYDFFKYIRTLIKRLVA
jgi:O-antigen/teichoic acid export membrane protein